MNQTLLSHLRRLQQTLAAAHRRLLVVLEGSPDWTLTTAHDALDSLGAESVLWFSQRIADTAWVLPPHKLNHELGREADHGVFDAYSGLNADALAALSGNIRGGGILWLLAPPLGQWSEFDDALRDKIAVEPWGTAAVKTDYAGRMAWLLQQDPCVCRISEANGFSMADLPRLAVTQRAADEFGCVTRCQRQAVDSVLHVMRGHRRRPLVVEADRGRGKSAAVGIAIRQLAQEGKQVIVTAPRPENVETLLRFATQTESCSGSVTFYAPDRLLATTPAADLLVVDEAAAIAPELLKTMLRHYSRAVFATTVNGYEGTGRGFKVRFQRYLDDHYPGWVKLTLDEPVRWQSGDWLEQSLNKALLLKPEVDSTSESLSSELHYSERHFSEFRYRCDAHTETQLNQIFELLITAHYRTRPSDLRSMLDGSNVRLFTLMEADRVKAVAMVAVEGQLQGELAQAIVQGRRRPHGQVLPQSLAVHLGQTSALAQQYWRVVRIAVQPDSQNQGLGSEFLQWLITAASAEGVDVIGSLFSGNQAVLGFWQRNHFAPVRVGYTREATTGEYSLLVVRGLSALGCEIEQSARNHFAEDFPLLLPDSHRQLPVDLVLTLLEMIETKVDSYERDQSDLQRFLSNSTTYENVAPAIWRLIWRHYMKDKRWQNVDETGCGLIVMKLLQNHPWEVCIDRLGLAGIKQARSLLRQSIAEWTQ